MPHRKQLKIPNMAFSDECNYLIILLVKFLEIICVANMNTSCYR